MTLIFQQGPDYIIPGYVLKSLSAFVLYTCIVIIQHRIYIKSQFRNISYTKKLAYEKDLALAQSEERRVELENKQKGITDSLNYARRIQQSLLPSEEYFRKHFSESFILHMPRDILSGDFYWIAGRDKKVFVAVADSTGHGVPGALMSMMGYDLLEKAINIDNMEHPSEVLDNMSRQIEKTFDGEKNSGSIVRDGIDLGLCVIDKEAKKIEFSGALFTLFIFRDNTLMEIKGDRYTLGTMPSDRHYRNKEIDIMNGDILYLFSDGYVDQFGGTENKKFKYRRFRYLLNVIHNFSVEDQKTILKENIISWMGKNSQLDDILVMGFKPQ